MTTPRVSVIVPVRDRAGLLAETLRGLADQTYVDFEVVVIDDGSKDASADVARRARSGGLNLRLVQTDGVGSVAARCAGIAEAAGDVLAFTDSDCVPEPGWLAAGITAMDKGADVVQGHTIPARPAGPLERSITHDAGDGLFPTCNVFYTRAAYDRAGGFDRQAGTRLGFRTTSGRALGFGEDTLLGWRVAREGERGTAHEAVVRHAVLQPSIRELLWRAWLIGGFPELIRECPELRGSDLYQAIFFGRRRLPLYTAIVLLAARQRLLAGVATVGWAAGHGRRTLRLPGPMRRRIVAVPVEMAIDVFSIVALIVGSIRARSIRR
ncbi:MAG: glycosyltransferase family A protein [Actinomycetota bacterium]